MKRDVQDGLPGLKKQNLRHADYAGRSVQELFTSEQLANAVVKEINYSSSCIAFNRGNGKFEIRTFPPLIQFSSVRALAFADLNNDGAPDIILGGNEFNFQPQLGRLDANPGYVLLNDGKGNFTVQEEKNQVSI